MIKVLQIYDSTVVNAGINIEIMNWYRNIDKKEFQFDFLSTWKRYPNFDEEIKKLGGNSMYISEAENLGNPLNFVSKVKSFMKDNSKDYNIIHLHTGPLCYPYLYYAKKYGVKSRIVHAHSLSSGNRWLSSVRNDILLFPMKRLASHFFACSEEAAYHWFTKRNIDEFFVINNGVPLERFKYSEQDRNAVRNEFNINSSQSIILHISNMSALKNIPFLFETFSRIKQKKKDCVLLLVGKKKLSDETLLLIDKYGLNDSVINYGITDNVARLISGSDLCLMPSKTEGFGLVPIECQSCRTPVIISDGFPEVVCATKYAKRLPLNVDIWTRNALEIFCNHEKEDDDIDKALNAFDIREVTQRLQELYRGILA